ncbi:hypothetical protein Hanom_Chr12g01151751 [Helianthus anomalus]
MVVWVHHATFNYLRTRTLLVIVGFNKISRFKLLTMIGNGAIGEPCRVIFMSKEPNFRRLSYINTNVYQINMIGYLFILDSSSGW